MNCRASKGFLCAIVAALAIAVAAGASASQVPESIKTQALAFTQSVGGPSPDAGGMQERMESGPDRPGGMYVLRWSAGEARVEVGITVLTQRVVWYSLYRDREEFPVPDGSAEISPDFVETSVLSLAERVVGPAEWWVERPPARVDSPVGQPFRAYLDIRLWRLIEGRVCDGDFLIAGYDLFDGKLVTLDRLDYGIRVPPAGPILPEAQARTIARAAFIAGGGPAEAEADIAVELAPCYSWRERRWRYFRLAYDYYFDMEFELAPGIVQVTVDAVTGEVLSARQATGGGSGGFRAKPPAMSARRRMLARLADMKAPEPLIRAFTALGRARPGAPPRSQARWKKRIGEQALEWSSDAPRKRLYWREGNASWNACDIALSELKLLETWVRTGRAGVPKAKPVGARR